MMIEIGMLISIGVLVFAAVVLIRELHVAYITDRMVMILRDTEFVPSSEVFTRGAVKNSARLARERTRIFLTKYTVTDDELRIYAAGAKHFKRLYGDSSEGYMECVLALRNTFLESVGITTRKEDG